MQRRVRLHPVAIAAITALMAGATLSVSVSACGDPVPRIAGASAVASAVPVAEPATTVQSAQPHAVRRVSCKRVDGDLVDCAVRVVQR